MNNLKLNQFKEITIGQLSRDELLKRLDEAGVQFNEYAKLLFNHD